MTPTTIFTGKTYDFYKDSNVQDVVACLDVLQEIRGRVQKELQQWPDHAVLNDVSRFSDLQQYRCLVIQSATVTSSGAGRRVHIPGQQCVIK